MGRIITTVATVIVLAVLVSMNIGFTTSVNLFGRRFEAVSVIAVAALSFGLGVVYSLFIYIGIALHRRAKKGLDGRDRRLVEREKDLEKKYAEADHAPGSARRVDTNGNGRRAGPKGTESEVENVSPVYRSGLSRLRGFFKARP